MNDTCDNYLLTKNIEVLVDKPALLTLEQILSPKYFNQFYHINSEAPSFSASSAAIWVRATIIDSTATPKNWCITISYPPIEHITIYEEDSTGNFNLQHWNNVDTHENYSDYSRFPIFSLTLKDHKPVRIFIRFQSYSSIPLLMYVRTKEKQVQSDHHDQFMLGGFYGILLIMVIYNLFLFFSIRDRAYLFYVLYACSFGVYQSWVDGMIGKLFYLFSNSGPLWGVINSYLFPVCGILFTRKFLNTKTLIPKFDRIIKIVLLIFALLIMLMFFLPLYLFNDLAIFVGGIYFFIFAVAGVLTLRLQYRPAKFYLVAVAGFSIGFIVRMLRLQGIIPMTEIAQNSLQVGFLWEVTMFSLALGDRFNTLREEKEKEKQRIRTQIAQDLHDDVSATLSSISFFVNAIKRLSTIRRKETKYYLERIAESADKAKENIADIVWSIETTNSSLPDLFSKFERFASDMFESVNIEYTISIQKNIPKNLQFDQKQQLWLIMKELVTNICRHSQATHAVVQIQHNGNELLMVVKDDGKGFEIESLKHKNGILHIPRRTQLLQGKHTCVSASNKGTTWEISIPLNSKN